MINSEPPIDVDIISGMGQPSIYVPMRGKMSLEY